MDYSIIILAIIAAVNVGVSALLFLKSFGNPIRATFGLVLLFTALWTGSMLLFRAISDEQYSVFFGKATFSFGLLIVVTLVYFSYVFPYSRDAFRHFYQALLWVGFILVNSLIFVFPGFVINWTHLDSGNSLTTDPIRHAIFAIYFLIIALSVMGNLFRKYLMSTGINRYQIRLALMGIVFAFIMGTVFDIVLIFGNNYTLNYIGPLSTLIMNLIIVRMILLKPRE